MNLPRLIAALPLLLILFVAVSAQKEWVKVSPYGESFTVLMPTSAVVSLRRIQAGGGSWVPGRAYYSVVEGRRYSILAFARTKPDRTPALASFDAFMQAMEFSLTNTDGRTQSLTFDSDLSDESGIVKQYQLQVGDYRGVARFIGTENFFYAQTVIGADVNDSDAQRFLRSFLVGQKNTDKERSNVVGTDGPAPTVPPDPWPETMAPISGGVLNGKAISLILPKYPKEARKNHDEGMVKVRIVIDEEGKVSTAEAIEGPESLRQAAVDAALKSVFTPTRLMGQPIKVTGVIIYNFVAQ